MRFKSPNLKKWTHLHSLLAQEKARRLEDQQRYCWETYARAAQKIPPGDWRTWLILAGRGFGKTRTGAETLRQWVTQGLARRIALIGASLGEVEHVMVKGPSGLLAVHPPQESPLFHPSKRTLIWPNGTVALLYGGEYPDQLRGAQFDAVWIDELAKIRQAEALWDQVQLALRLGTYPRCVITTTPKPLPLLTRLISDKTVVLTKGSTFDNEKNLAPSYLESMRKQFLKTRLGAQELYAQMLTETAGALWTRDIIAYRAPPQNPQGLTLRRIVIAIDPATTCHQQSDETGILVAGMAEDQRFYVLEDLSGKYSPNEWGKRVVSAYHHYGADRVVAEVNKGGDLVEQVIRSVDSTIPYKSVRASKGKYTRAEPVAALYEQGRVFHVRPFTKLESQLCTFIPGASSSPDRMDALVWALTELALQQESGSASFKVWTFAEKSEREKLKEK